MVLNDKRPQKVDKNKNFRESLYFALSGWRMIFVSEKNFRFHCLAAALVMISGLALRLTSGEWLWVCLAIALVLFAEMMNTVVETLVDLVTNYQFHPLAKRAKDIAAGAVLLIACLAILIGVLIFIPKLLAVVDTIK